MTFNQSEYNKQYRLRNLERLRAYGQAWREANRAYAKEYNAEYREENKDRLSEAKKIRYRQNADEIRAKERQRRIDDGDRVRDQNRNVVRRTKPDPVKTTARIISRDAIKRGELIPGPCERCGVTNRRTHDGRRAIHAHHDDYSKPLDVRWLCVDCHALEHRKVA